MTTLEKIAFVDLRAQHEPIREEIQQALAQTLDTSGFIGGTPVSQFEAEFAKYLGVSEAIGVGNGTDALWLALYAAGVRPGDAVITVPNTFIATVEGITRVGAHPLFVDIDLETANLSPAALAEFLENECAVEENGQVTHKGSRMRVAAVLPVHLYGQPADLTPIMQTCEKYGLPLVEDACQAHGADYQHEGVWRRAGGFGVAAAFSFYPGKNLGAIGDAGAVVTNDPVLAAQMRELRSHGSSQKYVHTTHLGWNARLDAFQAAVLSIKLRHLDEWNENRRSAARWYNEGLAGLPMALPVELSNARHVYHLYVVRVEDRKALQNALQACGIETGIHYPIPLHLQEAYAWMNIPAGSFPNAERSARTILSLPMHPAITEEQVQQVCEACKSILTAI